MFGMQLSLFIATHGWHWVHMNLCQPIGVPHRLGPCHVLVPVKGHPWIAQHLLGFPMWRFLRWEHWAYAHGFVYHP